MKLLSLCIIYIFLSDFQTAIAQSLLFSLPESEKDAVIMLEDKTLDSSTWLLARPYYDQPINVPQGELKILSGIFPEYINRTPDAKDLERYEPWSKINIDKFFDDYPDLLNVKPILSFETSKSPYKAGFGFSFHDYIDTSPLLSTRFSCGLYRTMTANGRAKFSDNSARWQRRSASIRHSEAGVFTIGNFDMNIDKGLIFGNFPVSDTDTTSAFNWLYASANSWNGAMYEFTGNSKITGAAFVHERPLETIYGVKGSIEAANNLHVTTGITRASFSEKKPETFTFITAEFSYISDNWKAGIITDAEPAKTCAIPFLVYIMQSKDKAGINASYAHIPGECNTRFSAIKHTWSEKLSGNDSLKGNSNTATVQYRMPLSPHLRSNCGVSYYYLTGMSAIESFIALTGTTLIDYDVKYGFRRTAIAGKNNNELSVFAHKKLWNFLQCGLNGRYVNSKDTCQSCYGRFTVTAYPRNGIELTSFVSEYWNSGNKKELCIGISHSMRLFEKTWSRLKIEAPVIKNFLDTWEINAEIYFLL
jgi:hypothetical protein